VANGLEKLPADRFESAEAFAEALGDPGFRYGGGERATDGTASPGSWTWLRDARTVTLAAVAVLALGSLVWTITRSRGGGGPEIYDIALPDSAPMDFTGVTPSTPYGSGLRGLTLSPDAQVAAYMARAGSSTVLWRRSLRDTVARPIEGTEGGSAPRISPDGSRLAFVAHGSVMVVPMAGGQPRAVAGSFDPYALKWIAPTTLLVVDNDGHRFRRIDPDAGTLDTRSIPYCLDAWWIAETRQVVCNDYGVERVVDPATGDNWVIRTRTAGGHPSAPLAGSAVELVDGRYLVYESPQGELRAAPYDRTDHTVGRAVSMLPGIRLHGAGAADYDISPTGTLVYAPGSNATIGRLVALAAGGAARPLPIPPGAYERWDLSRDERHLAAVVAGPGSYRLRIFDLDNGQSFDWLQAVYIGQPVWSPDGSTLLVNVKDSTGAAILWGSPTSASAPDTIYASSDADAVPELRDWSSLHHALGVIGTHLEVVRFDPLAASLRFDTIASDRNFPATSPDGRHMVFSLPGGARVIMTAAPPDSWQRQIAASGVEPLWLSSSEILYRSGFTWYAAHVDPSTGEPVGTPSEWGSDPRFSDTFGWSNRPDWHGGITYLQGPPDTHAAYLRVIPHWVAQMERAVDEANQ